MTHTRLDTLAHTGPWRDRHPADKAVLALGLLVCAVALPPWPGALVVGTVALVLLAGPAAVGLGRSVRLLGPPAAFIAVGAVPLLVSVGGPTLLRFDPGGLARAGELVGRSVGATLCLVLFAATTPLADVLPRLAKLGVPPAVTEVAALIYRLLFLLLDTAVTVREAQAGRLGFATRRAAMRSVAGQASTVFVRAFDRARRLEEGLALRGYAGDLAVDLDGPRPSRPFLVGSTLLVVAVIAVSLILRSVVR
jgi:cobalt/nickel transport system permease protein